MGTGIAQSVPQTALERMLGSAGRGLGSTRNWMNKSFGIPGIETGMGLGDMFMGQAPEMLDDLSYGAPMWKGKGFGGRLDPRMADVALLPLPWASGGKIGQMGLRGLGRQLTKEVVDRRKVPRTDALGMKAEQIFDPKGVDYDDILKKTGHWIGDPDKNPATSLIDPSKRKALQIGAAGATAAALGPRITKGLMDAKPHPYYSDAVVADLARPIAGAAARATVSNPSNLKMAQLILSSANPKGMLKKLKDTQSEGVYARGEYGDALKKGFKEFDNKEIDFPDIDDMGPYGDMDKRMHDFDLDEIESLVQNRGASGADRKWVDIKEFDLDDYEVYQMIEDASPDAVKPGAFNYDHMFASYQDNGVNPTDLIDYIRKNEGSAELRLQNVPDDLKALFKKIEDDPEEYYKHLDELNHNNSFNRMTYTDESLNNPNDDFYFEPGFIP